MCEKAVNICLFVFDSVPDPYNLHDMCNRAIYKHFLMLKYSLDKYKTQEMCAEAVNHCQSAIKRVSGCSGTSKLIKNLILLYSLMMMSYLSIQTLTMLHLLVVKWIFLL